MFLSLKSLGLFLEFAVVPLGSFLVSVALWSSAISAAPKPEVTCRDDAAKQEKRSLELLAIVNQDQKDRQNWESKSPGEMFKVMKRDTKRRMRVGEIFGEGCFLKASDFAAAALVYQHGTIPDHFFQTYLWAKRAVELGDPKQKHLMALGIDRYLVSIGQRQLFGSQASKVDLDPKSCWCLQQREGTFPDSLRKEYLGPTWDPYLWLTNLNKANQCSALECPAPLKPSPAGTVPGFW